MTLARRTRKLTKATAPARDILDSEPKSVVSGEEEEEDGGYSESKKKRDKAITARTGRPHEPPSRNDDEDYDDKEGEGSPGSKEDDGHDDDCEDDVLDDDE